MNHIHKYILIQRMDIWPRLGSFFLISISKKTSSRPTLVRGHVRHTPSHKYKNSYRKQNLSKPKPFGVHATNLDDVTFPCGKYMNQRVVDVLQTDASYVKYWATTTQNKTANDIDIVQIWKRSQQSQSTTTPPPTPPTRLDGSDELVFPFGKYKGRSINSVRFEKGFRSYLEWWAHNITSTIPSAQRIRELYFQSYGGNDERWFAGSRSQRMLGSITYRKG